MPVLPRMWPRSILLWINIALITNDVVGHCFATQSAFVIDRGVTERVQTSIGLIGGQEQVQKLKDSTFTPENR